MSDVMTRSARPKIRALPAHRKVFTATQEIPWTAGPLEKTWFKLLRIDRETGGTSMLFRVDREAKQAPIHKHIGCIEGYISKGDFAYGEDKGKVGSYLYEQNGSIHQPTTAAGFEAFLINRGTLIGYHPDGRPAAMVDASTYYQLAKANGAASHLTEFDPIYGPARSTLPNPFENMPDQQIVRTDNSVIEECLPDRPVFFDTQSVEWTPWIMEGTRFKLLHVNEETGGWSMMLKVAPGQQAAVHHHIGSIEGYIVEGSFYYGPDDKGGPGDYVYEPAEAIHEPKTDEGFTMFAVFNGPVVGYTDDGQIDGVTDQETMLELARASGVATHIDC